MSNISAGVDCPLCVDLDGTLIATDAMFESILLLGRRSPLKWLQLPLWLRRGKPYLKDQLAKNSIPDPQFLPYRAEILDLIRREKQAGRRIVLATASNERIARAIADHLGFFDEVIASNATRNLSSHE